MTLLTVENLLFAFFAKNDSFNLERDFKKVIVITDSEKEEKAIVLKALEKLCEIKMLNKCEYEIPAAAPTLKDPRKEVYYVLTRPLETYEQNIEIKYVTAHGIAELINSYCESVGDKENLCAVSNITEKDIQNILSLCHKFLSETSKENED